MVAREASSIIAMSVECTPLVPQVARLGRGGVVELAGRPPLRPLAASAASPAWVRSVICVPMDVVGDRCRSRAEC